jgi:hypothetical protein
MQEELELLKKIQSMDFNKFECRLWVIKKYHKNGQNKYKALYAAIEELDVDLRNALKAFFIGNESTLEPIKNLKTYKALTADVDEDCALVDNKDNTDFATIINEIEDGSDNHPVSDFKEFNKAWALVFEFSSSEQKLYAFSKVKGGWNLKKRILKSLLFDAGAFKKVEPTTIFTFRDVIDFVAIESLVFIRDKANYELGLNIREALEAKRDVLADALAKHGIVASIDDFKLVIGTNKTLLRRCVAIEETRYFEDQSFIEQMKNMNTEHKFGLPENESGQFVIDENNVDLFLKLVNDKRFISLIKKQMVDADIVEPVINKTNVIVS